MNTTRPATPAGPYREHAPMLFFVTISVFGILIDAFIKWKREVEREQQKERELVRLERELWQVLAGASSND